MLVHFAQFTSTVPYSRKQRALVVDRRENPREYDILKKLLGRPKGDPHKAKAISGVKETTRLHKLCSGKAFKKPKDDWNKEELKKYDKMICGFFTMEDEQKRHEENVAKILTSNPKEKSLDDQKKDLIAEVNKLAYTSGPLPTFTFGGR